MSEKQNCKLLIVDDDEDVLTAARIYLKQHFTTLHTESNPKRMLELIQNDSYDVILLDMNYSKDVTSGKEGFYYMEKILEIDPSAVILLITAYGDVETAVKAIKNGAYDFVLKPWQNEKLLSSILAALKIKTSQNEVNKLKSFRKQFNNDCDKEFSDFIGKSDKMLKVFDKIQKVAGTDANVLILGENGTGKELAARAIHRFSERRDNAFISVDLGALNDSIFESELFGHTKGAFTDAREERIGRFEIANDGTLFLDEIGNIPQILQSKLLTVLENRNIIKVGSNKQTDINIRLVCATNMPLQELVTQNKFRQDLLYRINTVEINLPPLRERSGDIPLLANYFLNIYAAKYKKQGMCISTPALNKLERYHWQGNVRELKHAIERSVILSDSSILQPEDFVLTSKEREGTESIELEKLDLETIEKIAVQKALQKYSGNISKAAEELGLTRTSLYRRMEKFGF
ncbi:MAG: sigma-54 dependent transcriptional regulator [bacterium]